MKINIAEGGGNLHESFIKGKGRKSLKSSKSTVWSSHSENTAVLRARISAQMATIRNKELLGKEQERSFSQTSKLKSERRKPKPVHVLLSEGDDESRGGGGGKYFVIHDESRPQPKLCSPPSEGEVVVKKEMPRMNQVRAFD